MKRKELTDKEKIIELEGTVSFLNKQLDDSREVSRKEYHEVLEYKCRLEELFPEEKLYEMFPDLYYPVQECELEIFDDEAGDLVPISDWAAKELAKRRKLSETPPETKPGEMELLIAETRDLHLKVAKLEKKVAYWKGEADKRWDKVKELLSLIPDSPGPVQPVAKNAPRRATGKPADFPLGCTREHVAEVSTNELINAVDEQKGSGKTGRGGNASGRALPGRIPVGPAVGTETVGDYV